MIETYYIYVYHLCISFMTHEKECKRKRIKIKKIIRQCIIKKTNATIIQKLWRRYNSNKNFKNHINMIINQINKYQIEYNQFFMKCLKIQKKYPPSKNEYKFIFGGLIEKSLIDFLNNIFNKCQTLDTNHLYGSEYKNDCILYLTNYVYYYISIKAKSKKQGDIILINIHGNKKIHDLNNLITFVVIIEKKNIVIIPHYIVESKYIKNNKANISYKSSLITHIYKNKKELIINLNETSEFIDFVNHELEHIKPHDLYNDLYSKL